jgi:hypothetical protein
MKSPLIPLDCLVRTESQEVESMNEVESTLTSTLTQSSRSNSNSLLNLMLFHDGDLGDHQSNASMATSGIDEGMECMSEERPYDPMETNSETMSSALGMDWGPLLPFWSEEEDQQWEQLRSMSLLPSMDYLPLSRSLSVASLLPMGPVRTLCTRQDNESVGTVALAIPCEDLAVIQCDSEWSTPWMTTISSECPVADRTKQQSLTPAQEDCPNFAEITATWRIPKEPEMMENDLMHDDEATEDEGIFADLFSMATDHADTPEPPSDRPQGVLDRRDSGYPPDPTESLDTLLHEWIDFTKFGVV